MKTVPKHRDTRLYGTLFALVALISSLPALVDGIFFSGHDITFHMQRIISIANGLRAGQFPVRIYSEVFGGYGYGAPLFYPEIFLYFPAALVLLGVPLSYSYNIFLVCVNLATLASAIYAFTIILGERETGFLGGVLYTLSAYRLIDIYTRASVGEYLALIFLPLCLCALVSFTRGETKHSWKVLTLGFSGLLQSHILSFALMTVAAAVFCLCHWRDFVKWEALWGVIKAILVTVALNLWFLVPFLEAYGMDVVAKHTGYNFLFTGTAPAQLFDVLFLSVTGSDTYGGGLADCMPKTVGLPLLLGALACFLTRQPEDERLGPAKGERGYLLAGAVAVWMTTTLFPWAPILELPIIGSFLEKFQFMWRFNILALLCLTVPAARGWFRLLDRAMGKRNTLIVMAMLACVFSSMYVNSFIRQSSELVGGKEVDETIRESSGMDVLYLVEGYGIFSRPLLESNAENIEYTDVDRGDGEIALRYRLSDAPAEEAYIDVPITYYPGYAARIDGQPAQVRCADSGVVRVMLPADRREGTLRVEYRESPMVVAADIFSALTLLACLAGLIVSQARRKKPAAHLQKNRTVNRQGE